ncbi:hypothetical protein D3C75_1369500 [compost metagenome]
MVQELILHDIRVLHLVDEHTGEPRLQRLSDIRLLLNHGLAERENLVVAKVTFRSGSAHGST